MWNRVDNYSNMANSQAIPDDSHLFSEEELTQAQSDLLRSSIEVDVAPSKSEIKTWRLQHYLQKTEIKRMHSEFECERKAAAEFRDKVITKLDLLLQAVGVNQLESSQSQSLLQGISIPERSTLTAFVTISYPDGKKEDIFFSQAALRDFMASSKQRELVRKLLLHLHDQQISFLRGCTLTGKTSKGALKRIVSTIDGNDQVFGPNETTPLPLRTVLIIQEVVKKLSPIPDEIKQSQHLLQVEYDRLGRESRANITSILNYYQCSYDKEGFKLPSKSDSSKRRRSEGDHDSS